MDFWEKITENPYSDLLWNIPEEQKIGKVAVIGGNGQNFRTAVKTAEYLMNNFPAKEVKAVLPDSLKNKLPPLDNLIYLKSTEVGSFAKAEEIRGVIDAADSSILIGDLSKNSITAKVVVSAVQESKQPLTLTRDAVDVIAGAGAERILMRADLTIMGSIVQWQKILKAVYYPKILQPSQPILQVAEVFHKFTLSYPVQVVALHEGQIIVAQNGRVVTVPLEKSGYSALSIWGGELASRIMMLNLYNPERFVEATVAAIFK